MIAQLTKLFQGWHISEQQFPDVFPTGLFWFLLKIWLLLIVIFVLALLSVAVTRHLT